MESTVFITWEKVTVFALSTLMWHSKSLSGEARVRYSPLPGTEKVLCPIDMSAVVSRTCKNVKNAVLRVIKNMIAKGTWISPHHSDLQRPSGSVPNSCTP